VVTILALARFAFINEDDGSPLCLRFALAPASAASCCAGPPARSVLTRASSVAGCSIPSAEGLHNTSEAIPDITITLDQIRDVRSGPQSGVVSEPLCTAFQFLPEAPPPVGAQTWLASRTSGVLQCDPVLPLRWFSPALKCLSAHAHYQMYFSLTLPLLEQLGASPNADPPTQLNPSSYSAISPGLPIDTKYGKLPAGVRGLSQHT
jgi:hypothetical protein